MTLDAARERMAAEAAAVSAALTAREAAVDEAQRRAAEAELRLRREALAEAREALAVLERQRTAAAQADLDAELRALVPRVLADIDRVLAGAHALHRVVSVGLGRGLFVPSAAQLHRDHQAPLVAWRDRLRRLEAALAEGRGRRRA